MENRLLAKESTSFSNIPDSQIYVHKTDGFLTQLGSNFSRILEKETVIISNSGATLGVAKLVGIKGCANDGIAVLLNVDNTVYKNYVFFWTQKQNFWERLLQLEMVSQILILI